MSDVCDSSAQLMAFLTQRIKTQLPKLALTERHYERIEIHAQSLMKWSPIHNLTALKSPEAMAEYLFFDALLMADALREASERGDFSAQALMDVGSGGGFPALVLLSVLPEMPAVLFEKDLKKQSFLKITTSLLNLHNVVTESAKPFPADLTRVNTLPNPKLWTSRATFAPEKWLTLALAAAASGDWIAVQTSDETELLPEAFAAMPCERRVHTSFRLPSPGAVRWLSFFQKL